MTGIYKFTNKYNRKVYVGKSSNIEERYNAHMKNMRTGRQSYFYTALRKYGPEGFDFDIIMECPNEDKILNYWEKFYIRYYCSRDKKYGYNMTEGGDGLSNPCEEVRKKNSDYHKTRVGELNSFYGKHHTEETREELSIISTELWKDEEYRNKHDSKWTEERRQEYSERMSEMRTGQEPWNKNKPCSEEQKEKQRQKMAGRTPWNKGKKGVQVAWNKGKKKIVN